MQFLVTTNSVQFSLVFRRILPEFSAGKVYHHRQFVVHESKIFKFYGIFTSLRLSSFGPLVYPNLPKP